MLNPRPHHSDPRFPTIVQLQHAWIGRVVYIPDISELLSVSISSQTKAGGNYVYD
jgi:hypothetical protein